MEKYIYDETNGLWYELQGDYYIPCLALPAEKENKPIGLWGQRHKRYLQEHKRAVYTTLLTSGRLFRRDELERFRPSPNLRANAGKYPHSHPYPLRFSG